MRVPFCLCLVSLFALAIAEDEPVYMCDSLLWCKGPLVEAVNRLEVFNDSKHFVDMPAVKFENETMEDFHRAFPNPSKITKNDLINFITDHFYQPGNEMFECKPDDWTATPDILNLIQDEAYRDWTTSLNKIWKLLCRRMRKDIDLRHSLIYVPHSFIAPGGRFREFYYWDTYWIIKGLLASKMYHTAKDMLRNFAYVVEKYGFIPNGGRIYYLQRTQPPLFTPMVYEYFMETHDQDTLDIMLPRMEQELDFWLQNRSITVNYAGREHNVFHYQTLTNTPRPEGYKQDVLLAQGLDEQDKQSLYQNLATAAEAGWDFSSRWLGDAKTLKTIRTKEIIPVDLNSFMYWNFDIMRTFMIKKQNISGVEKYKKLADDLKADVESLFYDSNVGTWFDFDSKAGKRLNRFYASTVTPLFTDCYDRRDPDILDKFYAYLNKTGVLNFPVGVPASLTVTNQQWDYPNGWAPLTHIMIEGLRKSGHPKLQAEAFELASKWLSDNYLIFRKTGHMYEKYNITVLGSYPGSGGEYEVQIGFGWSNGVALDLLRTYGHRLVAPEVTSHGSLAAMVSVPYLLLLIAVGVLARH